MDFITTEPVGTILASSLHRFFENGQMESR
jgi:hypothetical protein